MFRSRTTIRAMAVACFPDIRTHDIGSTGNQAVATAIIRQKIKFEAYAIADIGLKLLTNARAGIQKWVDNVKYAKHSPICHGTAGGFG